MQKIICKTLAIFLLLTMLPVLPSVMAEDAEKTIPIQNPGFEELSADGWATGWGQFQGDATYSIESKSHSGEKAVRIHTDAENNPWVATTVRGLIPSCQYELSVFINSSASGRGASTKIEYFKENPKEGSGWVNPSSVKNVYPNGEYLDNTNNVWVEHKTIFTVPEGAEKVKIYLRLYAVGDVWFDDVTLKESGGPAKYSFDTEKVFHYKEETGGDAFVNIHSFYENTDTAANTLIDFTIYHGKEVYEKAENVTFKGLEARYTYSTQNMIPYERYTLKCTIKDTAGTVLEEHEQNLYVVDRPSMLGEDGNIYVDGKIFKPITGYHVLHEDYEKAVEGGINTVQMGYGCASATDPEERETTLKLMEANGLKGIFCLYYSMKNAGHPDNIEGTKAVVELVKDNPHILAYALQDEPFLEGDSKEARLHCEEAYLAIRKIDKMHPIYLCDKNNEYISSKYCDVLCADLYARGNDSSTVSKGTVRCMEYIGRQKPFIELAATYLANEEYPSMNVIRNSVYRAFEDGARGVGYYCFSDAGSAGDSKYLQLYKWDLWEDFCGLNKLEVPILFDYAHNGYGKEFNYYDDGEDVYSLRWFTWFSGDDMYLIAHNRGREAKTANILMESKNGKVRVGAFKAEPIGLTAQPAFSGTDKMILTLGIEEVALFRIIPAETVDLSRVNESRFDDLSEYAWAKEQIEALDAKGIVNSIAHGQYGPAQNITRLDFVSFLVRALGLTEEGEAFPDCDVQEIKIARKAGITNGDTDGNFRPNDTITRQDIMTTACRALNAAPTDKEIPAFSDWNLISDYALDSVKTMVQAEVIVGNGDGTLNPLGLATRAEAAVMLHRMLNTEFNKATANAPDVPKPDVKEEITFSGNPDDNTLQIWNNATVLLKALGVTLPEIEKSVTHSEFENAVSALIGTNYEAFEEDLKAIRYEEAVEALVKLLGYEAYAPSRGGYMAMAAQLALIKGLSPEEHIRAGELAVLLANAADIKTAERTDFGKNEEYRESNDTLLSLYRNIHKVKGVVEETYYTGADVRRGEILLDGEVYTGGEEYHRQRVVAFAEFTEDEKKILYIEPASGTEVVTVEAEDILEADTSVIRYETENGKDELVSIAGATVYVNGEKKVATGADFRPEHGTVSLVFTSGTVTSILVEKYENRIVQSVYKEDNTVYFKNGKELILENDKVRYYIDFEAASLNEWNVLSVYSRGDGSLYKVKLSMESVQGAPSEISEDGILLGDNVYPVSKACFGTPALGVSAKFYLDVNGKIAAVDDKNLTPEYGYLMDMQKNKGVSGGVSVRILTKENSINVFRLAENIRVNNAEEMRAENVLSSSIFMSGENVKEQLVIYELNGHGEISGMHTAIDAHGCKHQDSPDAFALVHNTGPEDGAVAQYQGYQQRTIGSMYRIGTNTVTFIVPKNKTGNDKDYRVITGTSCYEHGIMYPNSEMFDWREDFSVGAVVRKTDEFMQDVGSDALIGVVKEIVLLMNEEGEEKIGLRLFTNGQETTVYASEELQIIMNERTLSDVNKESEVTYADNKPVLKSNIMPTALDKGDVVIYSLGGSTMNDVTAMRVLFRADAPQTGERSLKGLSKYYNYSELTTAYGKVSETFTDGLSMFPDTFERVFTKYYIGKQLAQVVIYDKSRETIELSSFEGIHEGDYVFSAKESPYQNVFVVYRGI